MTEGERVKREMGRLAKEMEKSLDKADFREFRRLERRYSKLENKRRGKKAGRRRR